MRLRPMPVVMVSTLTARGAEVTLDALDLGAVDYFAKPTETSRTRFEAAASWSERSRRPPTPVSGARSAAPCAPRRRRSRSIRATDGRHRLSTGGVEALMHLSHSRQLPADGDHAAHAGDFTKTSPSG